MGRLIDADKLRYKHSLSTVNTTMPQSFPCVTKDEINNAPTVEAIPILKGATNGDMMKALFPSSEYYEREQVGGIKYITVWFKGSKVSHDFDWSWWNAPYKENEDGNDD